LAIGAGLGLGVLVIAVFGQLTCNYVFPALQFVRYASLGEYFKNLDISILGVWVGGIFINITLSFYVTVHAFSQLMKLKSYKLTILPMGILVTVFAGFAPKTIIDIFKFSHYIFPILGLIVAVLIPSLLLIVSIIRGKKNKTA